MSMRLVENGHWFENHLFLKLILFFLCIWMQNNATFGSLKVVYDIPSTQNVRTDVIGQFD